MRSSSSELKEFRHDSGEALLFKLVRSARKTLGLYVYRDGSVLVRAPQRVNLAEIFLFLRGRWQWLQEKRTAFADEALPVAVHYSDGVRFLHLGHWYTLRLQLASRKKIAIQGDEIHVSLPLDILESQEEIEEAIRRWQRQEAHRLFPLRLAFCHESMLTLKLPFPELRIRRMRSRWGSCSSRGVITLNLELIRMPPDCIDYVIIHELCHLVEFHHGPEFYALQERFMPDWEARKLRLNTLARQHYLQAPLAEEEAES